MDRLLDDAEGGADAARLDRPVVVYVVDPTLRRESPDELEDVVFRNERVALALKAFRTVRMLPESARKDLLLAGAGSHVPRLVLVDPVRSKLHVFERSRIKATAIYARLAAVANRFYDASLERTVKRHLRLLTERDQLAGRERMLDEQAGRHRDDPRRLQEIEAERRDVADGLERLAQEERTLWRFARR